MNGKISWVVSTGLAVMVGFTSQVSAGECVTAYGKIRNNGQPDGSTLGVVALNLGKAKYKCGIILWIDKTPRSLITGTQITIRIIIGIFRKFRFFFFPLPGSFSSMRRDQYPFTI